MEIFATFKIILLGSSFGTLFCSLIFLLFPDLYLRIEAAMNLEMLVSSAPSFLPVVEGKINFLNDWIFSNRMFFGTLFVLLSIYNIKSLIQL